MTEPLPTYSALSPDVPQCHTVLAYLECDGHLLMMHRDRKPNDLNAGYWIGVGGKLESGEDAPAALHREVREELGVTLTRWQYRKEQVTQLRLWQGDRLFLKELDDGRPFFRLQLYYDAADALYHAVLDGEPCALPPIE